MLKDLTIWILTYVLKRMAPQEVRAPGLLELNSALAAKAIDLQQQIDELSADYGTLKDKSLMLAQRIKDEGLYLEQTEGSLCLKLYKILQANEQLPLTREDVQQAVSIDIPEAGIMAATGSADLDKKEKSIDFLYVIKAAHRKRYKIGHSLDPAERLRTFQTGSPEHLTVVGKWPGGRTLEALLHSRLGVYCWQYVPASAIAIPAGDDAGKIRTRESPTCNF